MPPDDAPHMRTWMAWPASRSIWGRGLSGVQRDIAAIASTIAQFEPVTMCANPESAKAARRACGSAVKVIQSIPVDDLWMRDTAPIFRVGHDDRPADAVGLNFNGWGRKQKHRHDRWVAREVADHVGLPFTRARFVGEAGAIETDGAGTLLATVSSLVNDNRNPGMSKAAVEHAMLTAYGARKVIWVPGVRGRDITDDHIDSTCRFVRPAVVIVQVPPAGRTDIWARTARRQLHTLERATDAQGRPLQIVRLAGPDRVRSRNPDFLDSYVNFAVVNGAVITANFGDPHTDALARDTLGQAFPGREVVQLDVDHLHSGGGGIHCSTMQQPK
ncbi:MAG: agmatine deiminase family protein [Candidatus Nanopelagicales bacterium]